ncbi:hypothetical protein GLAREA_11492 [Glarea lozoyensis ATCC 20868]|uniref:Uncharacterized protein n=1 Tax=Glarea lozoyensis (strain ATCC 20868 / MF5171) TaxID=1116229 RepID=S3CYL0_GLAL2|nr:uncharacterized protein GLAREA_11492 [Glarea lozoyensis ATCC 20868]EPE24911.1 hypothetical protein GLAREA_11492 [Glarea lozoyensis ATCC 20868]
MLISILLLSIFFGLAVAGPFAQVPGQAPLEAPTLVVEAFPEVSRAPEPELWQGERDPPDERNDKGWPLLSDFIPNIFVDPKCSSEQKFTLSAAWADAKNLSIAQSTAIEDYDFEIPHVAWLGLGWDGAALDNTNDDAKERAIRKQRKHYIELNIVNNGRLYEGKRYEPHVIYWTCEDVEKKCEPNQISGKTHNDEEGVSAYPNCHTTIWCPGFFGLELLEEQIQRYRGDELAMSLIDNFAINAGTVKFHEVYKYEWLVSFPALKPDDFIQGNDRAGKVWNFARTEAPGGGGTKYAYITADSYVMDALAIFVYQSYGTEYPPIPKAVRNLADPPPGYDSEPRPPAYTYTIAIDPNPPSSTSTTTLDPNTSSSTSSQPDPNPSSYTSTTTPNPNLPSSTSSQPDPNSPAVETPAPTR